MRSYALTKQAKSAMTNKNAICVSADLLTYDACGMREYGCVIERKKNCPHRNRNHS